MDGLAARIKTLSKNFVSLRDMSRRCGLAETQITTTLTNLENGPKKKQSDISARILAKISTGCRVSLHWLVLGEGPMVVPDAGLVPDEPDDLMQLDLGPEHRSLARIALAQGASIKDVRCVVQNFSEELKDRSAGTFYDLIKRQRDDRLDALRSMRAHGRVDIPLASAPRDRQARLADSPDPGPTSDRTKNGRVAESDDIPPSPRPKRWKK